MSPARKPARRSAASRKPASRKRPAPRAAVPLDDPRRRERLDPRGMAARIESFPEQIRAGASIAAPALRHLTPGVPRRLVLFGMGGSAIAGDLLRAVAEREGTAPVHVVRHYLPPAWLTPEDFLVFSSYSGETEETLSAFEATRSIGARGCVLSTGGTLAAQAGAAGIPAAYLPPGHPPRAALGYSFATLAAVASHVGVVPGLGDRMEGAAQAVERVVSACGTRVLQSRNLAKKLAIRLAGRAVLVIGGERGLAAVAQRWKGQLNENAKQLAWASVLPEMNHNEVDGFAGPKAAVGRLAVVLLREPEEHPRIAARFAWLGAYLKRKDVVAVEVLAEGEDAAARLLGASALGDFVSYYLALANGVDPSALPGVESLKEALLR
ncbi:MAG TPA: bifunctional phosphoglucose/phosphomannose isomerase [Candidatus Binatia bacterium]|nr:bifunctional phosphoglucose/phosphomannose isomerase [Candidatus Binatia bacterium]